MSTTVGHRKISQCIVYAMAKKCPNIHIIHNIHFFQSSLMCGKLENGANRTVWAAEMVPLVLSLKPFGIEEFLKAGVVTLAVVELQIPWRIAKV